MKTKRNSCKFIVIIAMVIIALISTGVIGINSKNMNSTYMEEGNTAQTNYLS